MSVRGLTKMLPGGRTLFKDVSLAFQRGAKIGVLGLNGSGKSSLLKVIAGVDAEFDGTLWKADGLRIGYLMQEPVLDASKSVHDNIMDGLKEKTDLLARYEQLSMDMAAPDVDGDTMDALMGEQAEVQAKIEQLDCWNLAHTVETAKTALRVPPDDADVSKLSGGEKRRVALCRLLLEEPEVLLLDEPTNHLDAESVAWLERFLQAYKGTVLAITHDRYFLDNVAGWILELDRGQAFAYQGNYSMWLQKKGARLDLEKKQERKKAKAMEEELAWIRQGARVRDAGCWLVAAQAALILLLSGAAVGAQSELRLPVLWQVAHRFPLPHFFLLPSPPLPPAGPASQVQSARGPLRGDGGGGGRRAQEGPLPLGRNCYSTSTATRRDSRVAGRHQQELWGPRPAAGRVLCDPAGGSGGRHRRERDGQDDAAAHDRGRPDP